FGPAGFAEEALYPCYGLAESTLFVAGMWAGAGVGGSWISRAALENGGVKPAEPGAADAIEVPSCGHVAPGHRVVIADPDTGQPADRDTVGEVWVAGPSVASGYWRRPQESGEVFGTRLRGGDEPFLRTGDLGFLRAGQIYLTGRRKDLMVVHGRNIYPTDVEDVAQAVADCLRPGCGASFLTGDDSTDMVIVQETTEDDETQLRKLAVAIRQAVLERLNVAVADVVLIRPRTMAKTSSGKLRRRACRDDYLAGSLDTVFRLRAATPSLASARDLT
ncbi:MAG: AMP-binding protein, partial [Streptosporangiaceae bacterium]